MKQGMIEIYKKLPGKNCGKCGVPTCIAFSLKVNKSLASLSDCPFTASEENLPVQAPAAVSSYEMVGDQLEKLATGVDFRKAAAAIGGKYLSRGEKESIRLEAINRSFELRRDGLFENGNYCTDAWTKIIICDYVRRMGSEPQTGEWLSLSNFPRTASHVRVFQSNTEKKIAEFYGNDLERLKQHCAELGGVEIQGKFKADYISCIYLLPRVPVFLCFWAADEEFDSDCKLLFDRNVESYIDIEFLAHLMERFIADLVSSAHQL